MGLLDILNTATETRRISLSAINGDDKRYQIRESEGATRGEKHNQENASKNHINAIVKALIDNPKLYIKRIEVIVDPNDENKYIIVDGFHRYAAFSKVFKRSKGKRYKQLRVDVLTQGVSAERYLSINTEHQGLPLTAKQRTEQQWQEFVSLHTADLIPSIDETSKRLGISTSTVSNWRSELKKFKDKGFFNVKSGIPLSPLGFPKLEPCREALKKDSYHCEYEDRETLTEKDKELLEVILKQALKADNPDNLKAFVDQFWRENPKHVPYDMPISNLEPSDYDF